MRYDWSSHRELTYAMHVEQYRYLMGSALVLALMGMCRRVRGI